MVYRFLVVGGGIAGLSAAARLSGYGHVLCVTKETFAESNTAYAQGGIAVAMGGAEDVALHLEDTIGAGDGLVDRAAAQVLVTDGPVRVAELLEWGTGFDRGVDGALERTREGAHSLNRILHANGDATGKEIARALLAHVQTLPTVELREWCTTVDLLVDGQGAEARVAGAVLLARSGGLTEVRVKSVLIASGGAGQVYSETTNPSVATGDGIAMAYRAGAALEDMEFYQFHPTAYLEDGAPRFLMSEALRGEGAKLENGRGERFMPSQHPLAELAPRDVVARAIATEALDGPVYLDMREAGDKDLVARFPGISRFLAGHGLALGRDLIPVGPAAHYLMGGIRTDLHGRTTLQGLYAAGEAACTGVHGANRLASNSLLEGLVFGVLAAEAMGAEHKGTSAAEARRPSLPAASDGDVEVWIAQLRRLMWIRAGLVRDADGLRQAQAELDGMLRTVPRGMSRRAIEARNLYTVAGVIVECALGREESRGGHYRRDFPGKKAVAEHSVIVRGRLRFEA